MLRSWKAARSVVDARQSTAQALEQLPGDEWRVFHDIRLPGRQNATIDQVVVGPGGVFVIESNDWSRNVKVRRDVLRERGRLRDKALSGAVQAAREICGLVPGLDPERVRPVVSFARNESIMGWGRTAMVCSTRTLVPMLLIHPTVLDAAERRVLCRDLAAWISAAAVAAEVSPPRRTAARHIADSMPTRTNRRANKPTRPGKSSGAMVPFGAVGVGAALIATNPDLLSSAGHLLTRALG